MIKGTLLKFIVSFCAFLLLWEIVILIKSENGLLPRPIPVFSSISEILSNSKGLGIIAVSILSILKSLFYITILGVLLGLILGYFKKSYEYLSGLLSYFRSIPPIVLFPLFAFVLFGNSETARVACACFGCIPLIIVTIADCIHKIPEEKLEFAKLINADSWFVIKNIYFYELLPNILLGLRLATSFCIIIIIVTEMIDAGVNGGIGAEIISARMNSDYNLQFAYILIIGLIGFLLNELIFLIERKTVKWINR